jgi:hypothetical protein
MHADMVLPKGYPLDQHMVYSHGYNLGTFRIPYGQVIHVAEVSLSVHLKLPLTQVLWSLLTHLDTQDKSVAKPGAGVERQPGALERSDVGQFVCDFWA